MLSDDETRLKGDSEFVGLSTHQLEVQPQRSYKVLTVGPIAALQYTYANVNGFSENGSLAPMQIESSAVNSLRSDVGFRIFYQWQIGKILLVPSLKAAWEHEYLYSAFPITGGVRISF